jgi:hypothetical protein
MNKKKGRSRRLLVSSYGDYEIKCVTAGIYDVAPDSTTFFFPGHPFYTSMAWPFTPVSKTVNVTNTESSDKIFRLRSIRYLGSLPLLTTLVFPSRI